MSLLVETLQTRVFNRRSFLKLTGISGGGLMLGFSLRPGAAPAVGTDFSPTAFVSIAADGKVVIMAARPEIGQGVKTSLPMIVAEELDADWNTVEVRQAPINEQLFGAQEAGGSRSTPDSWLPLRRAGAVARAMLVAAAADVWQVPVAECVTEAGQVVHTTTGRKLGYGALAKLAAAQPVPDAATLTLKPAANFTILGRRIGGVDNHAIVTGQPLFGIDQVLPGMQYAVYQKCPAVGGSVIEANLEQIRALPGISAAFVLAGNGEVTELMPGVAIVGRSTWAVFSARKQLQVRWDESKASADSYRQLLARAQQLAPEPGAQNLANRGDVEQVFAQSERLVQANYVYPFIAHATLEPQNCSAWYRGDSIEIWAPTQTPAHGSKTVAGLVGLAEDRVTVHQLRCGGGFGRRLLNDYMCEAAAISQHIQGPVKLQWSREDDMAHDFYRPAGLHAFKAALDEQGRLAAWQDHFISFSADGKTPARAASIKATEFPAGLLPNFRLTQTLLPLATPTGWWRAPGSNGIAFAVQSFIHELAVSAGRDHLEFLLELMGEPRWLQDGNTAALNTGRASAVIKLAAQNAGWGRPMPQGYGLGLAFHFSHSGHVAEVAEVSVRPDKQLTVHKVWVVADVGPVINQSGAENQCEGSVIDGMSMLFGQQLAIENGRIEQTNFDSYPLLRMAQAPAIEVSFIRSDFAPTGLGEPALPPLAPAVCNAIFAACGERVRALPLKNAGYKV